MNDFLQNCIGIAIIMIALSILLVAITLISASFQKQGNCKVEKGKPRLPKPKN